MRIILLTLLIISSPLLAVDLVSRSTGLENPIKESGHTELEVGDVNGDGFLDIVSVGDHGSPMVNSDQHGIMVWLGDGEGNWSVIQTGNFGYGGCALGDINSDGFMDVVWGIHHDWGSGGFGDKLMGAALGDGTGSVWIPWDEGLNTGGEDYGMFATDLADFDLDGDLDMVCESFGSGNGVRVYGNNGNGTWEQVWMIDEWNSRYTVETGDFNADGCPDFICTRWGTQIYFGDGAFNFNLNQSGIPDQNYVSVDCGDFNNDGLDDIVCSLGSDSGVRCYSYNTGTTSWEEHSTGLPSGGVYVDMVQFGFIDEDENIDLVLFDDPTGMVYLGDGYGNWIPDATWTMPASGDASALRIDGDIDHDGREDIVIQAEETGGMFDRNQLRVYSPWSAPTSLAARIITPNGGETMYAGSTREIRWLTTVPVMQGQALVDIHLSTMGSGGPWTVVAEGIPDNGSFQWAVPSENSTDCRIRLTAYTGADTTEITSEESFSILYQTGISEDPVDHFQPVEIILSPNPTMGMTQINLQGFSGETVEACIFDISGRLLLSKQLDQVSGQGILLLGNEGADLSPGIYMVVIRNETHWVSTRLVKLPN